MNENIIKKLKSMKVLTDIQCTLEQFTHNKAIDTAINIIESEPEEVCNWYKNSNTHMWHSECEGDSDLAFAVASSLQIYFEYCPFCGKKIERI